MDVRFGLTALVARKESSKYYRAKCCIAALDKKNTTTRKFFSPTPSTRTQNVPLKITTSYQYPSGITVFTKNHENQPQYRNDLLWLKT